MLKHFGIYWLCVDYHGHSKSSGIDGEEVLFYRKSLPYLKLGGKMVR